MYCVDFMPQLFLTVYMPVREVPKVSSMSHHTHTATQTKEIMVLLILPG